MMSEGRALYGSWSRVSTDPPERVLTPEAALGLATSSRAAEPADSILPFGAGRTYGDTCVNAGGGIVDTTGLDRILAFDAERGVVRCEAGVTLDKLLRRVVPQGWVAAACPGTAHVTLGGAVAHDVHGKDQAQAGSLGCWVEGLTLQRSDGAALNCSPRENVDMFRATVGGLGLTGIILDVSLRLTPLESGHLEVERYRCRNPEEALALIRATSEYDYGLVWTDSFRPARGNSARYLVLRARKTAAGAGPPSMRPPASGGPSWNQFVPAWTFRRSSMRAFNRLYDRGGLRRLPDLHVERQPFDSFLFPQDDIHPSNHLYGRRGVRAHHSLIPRERDPDDEGLIELLARASRPRSQSMVTVLKAFGRHASPGLLSFCCEGTSVALGFPNEGQRTLDLMNDLDSAVLDHGGRLYPAKDGRMPARVFQASYPAWSDFARFVDPAHSSSFWRRVSQTA